MKIILATIFLFLSTTAGAAEGTEQQKFIQFLLPFVKTVNQEITKEREHATVLYRAWHTHNTLTTKQRIQLKILALRYHLSDADFTKKSAWDILLRRIYIIPSSLVIAQAINESAWGRSRFAKEGNNYFGHWCYRKGCGLVPKKRAKNARHEVAVFSSPLDSVRSYVHNLNTNQAYQKLRVARETALKKGITLTGMHLLVGLESYSERGKKYIDAISVIIKKYNLSKYDN